MSCTWYVLILWTFASALCQMFLPLDVSSTLRILVRPICCVSQGKLWLHCPDKRNTCETMVHIQQVKKHILTVLPAVTGRAVGIKSRTGGS